ncbi:MAG: TlpA family protein disulfide reductase [Paraclostridium bifermentans]|uniref:TlpA family protein disulfide reductase n=1 Tax=Paraclostridium bifermentans TaxID=1490 RepID=UPI00241F6D8E|nr:TlpA disulfide reductase family protein [Paraclostridium bifermentans]MBS5954573.1 TlpA family protein disulfide reductase [Paraclostridium bifermentans]
MKKIIKLLAIIVILFVGALGTLILIGPSDVVVLSEEEEKKQQQMETEQFKDVDLSGFKTTDLNGNKITSDLFSKNKLTMVNIWATWCGPCIDEMPEISKLYNELPIGTNVISICTDAGDDKDSLDTAKEVMNKSNAKFKTLIPDVVLKKNLTDGVQVFPTTIFIDSKGKVVGSPHFGEPTAEGFKKSIDEHLKLVEENSNEKN